MLKTITILWSLQEEGKNNNSYIIIDCEYNGGNTVKLMGYSNQPICSLHGWKTVESKICVKLLTI